MLREVECPVCETKLLINCREGKRYYLCTSCLYYCASYGMPTSPKDALQWIHKHPTKWISVRGIPVKNAFELKGTLRDFYSEKLKTFLSVKEYIKTHPGDCEKMDAQQTGVN